MELDEYEEYNGYDELDIGRQIYFNEDSDSNSSDNENIETDSFEVKKMNETWKSLKEFTTFDYEYWNNIVRAADEIRGKRRAITKQEQLEKLPVLLKIIDSKVPKCPEDTIVSLQCLVQTFLPIISNFERSTEANLLTVVNNIVDNLEQIKLKTISHLKQLLKERDATIAKLEQQIELLKANLTSESNGSSIAITNNLSRSGDLETLRRVENFNKDTALLFRCNACKQDLEKTFYSNSQLKQRANRKCKKCTDRAVAPTSSNVNMEVMANVSTNVITVASNNIS